MRFYKLSEARVKRILHTPKRIEEGIAPKTIAMMQPAGTTKHPYELWVMIQEEKKRRKVISAWRYPGKTKPQGAIIWNALERELGEYAATEKEEPRRKKWSAI